MKKMQNLILELNQKPLDFKIESLDTANGVLFSYLSHHDDLVYGRYWNAESGTKNKWIILYHGLGAHTGTPGYLEFVFWWTKKGYDVIGMDARNQGGLTKGHPATNPKGLYLSGLSSFNQYYYTSVYSDAYRLIDVAHLIKPHSEIIVNGGSQGGALALFVGAVHPLVDLILADMPSNVDIKKLIHTSEGGFKAFLSNNVIPPKWLFEEIDILSYAHVIKKPVLIASGDKDLVCPIETAKALMNELSGEKSFILYENYGHGGYDLMHFPKKIEFISKYEKKGK